MHHKPERQRECSQRHSEVRAGRLSGRFTFRLRSVHFGIHVQTGPVSSRSVRIHHGIFPYVYFYTQSLQRPHERRPMASRREQVSALFCVAWTQRRLTECFPWATEGPNPPKETLTFKKEFFWQTTSGSLPAGLNNICSFFFDYYTLWLYFFSTDRVCSNNMSDPDIGHWIYGSSSTPSSKNLGARSASLHCPPGSYLIGAKTVTCSNNVRWPRREFRPKCGEYLSTIRVVLFFFFFSGVYALSRRLL